ncbi:unnamed protein product [Urochloa humidicola]
MRAPKQSPPCIPPCPANFCSTRLAVHPSIHSPHPLAMPMQMPREKRREECAAGYATQKFNFLREISSRVSALHAAPCPGQKFTRADQGSAGAACNYLLYYAQGH